MAEPSDLDWGADVGPDDDFRASGSEDADDWLQDAEEMKAPASATPTPAVLHSCSPPSAPLTNAPGDPTLSPLTPPSKPQTPEQLPSGPTTPQVYRQLKLDSPHRSRRGITPATPINPLFLEEEEAEEGAAGGDASCEEQQHHQCDGAAIPTQGSGIPEVSSSGVGLAASSTGEPAQRRQREDVLQSEQELGRKQHQQQQQSEHGNPKGTTGQVAQPLPLGKKQQQQQQQQPLQLSEADEQQQQLSQLSEANNQKQEPLQLSEAPDLSRQEVKQQQQQQHELLEPQGRNALSQASNGAEIQPEQGKLQEHQQQQQQQQQQKEEGVSAGAETQTAGVWSWAGAWGSKLKAAAEAAVAVAAPPPEPPHAEDSQGDAHEQQHQQHQQHQQLSEPAAPGEAPAAPAAPAVPATMHASKEPTAAARDPATRAAAAAAAALAARQKPAAAAKQQRQSEPAPSSAGEVDRTSKKQGDGSQQLPTHSPPHPVCAKRADKQPVGQQRQAQHKVDSNEGRKRNDGESGHEDDQEGSPTDEDLERGLQAIDEQMGRIGGALSSWWGGINRNTASIMSKVEEIVSSGTLQKAATSKVKGLERRIEAVGRNALHLLEDLTGQYNYNLGAMQAGGQDGEPQDFDSFFALYGGKQLCADLESLANECARICNRARSRLEGFQQEELDSTLAELGPIFSERLSSGGPGQQLSGVWGNNEECARASEQLEQRYAPISYLSQDSQKRAQGFLEKLLEAAHQVQKLQGMGGGGQKQLQLRLRVLEPNGKDGTEQQQQQFGKSQEAEEKQQQQQQQQAVKSRESCTAARQLSELEWGQHACVVATIELPEEVRKEKQTQGRICSENKEKKGGEEVQGSERLRISRPGSMDGEDCSAGLTSSGMDSTGSLLPAATQPASEREACAKVQELLFGLRVHATKRLAEVATAQLQLLLDHGASLSAPARSQAVAASPSWPSLPSHQGLLLHQQCTRIVADIHAAANASVAVAAAAAAALPHPSASFVQGSCSISPSKQSASSADASARGIRECGLEATAGGAPIGKDAACGAQVCHGNAEAEVASARGACGVGEEDKGGRVKEKEEGGAQTKEREHVEESRCSRDVEQAEKGKQTEGAGSGDDEQEQQEDEARREEAKGSSEKERRGGDCGDEEGKQQRKQAPELDCGLLVATAHTLQAELQSAAHNATAYVEEALRGLLYAVLVRHLVVTIAGGDGHPQEEGAVTEAGVGRAVGCEEGQEGREAA